MEITSQVLALIENMADGEFHSGEELGRRAGVSRAAIWKTLQGMSELGIGISRVRGKGYCLDGGLSLLGLDEVKAGIPPHLIAMLDETSLLPCVDSTNKYLLQKLALGSSERSHFACLAEMQTSGRGRRGRVWQSPFGRNIYLSLSWQFQSGAKSMEGLSLAVGVAVAKTLETLAGIEVGLKWPNDILCGGEKLGGILIEIAGDAMGECHAVLGIGLNVDTPKGLMGEVGQPWTDIKSHSTAPPSRNSLAAELIVSLVNVLSDFEVRGFSSYRDDWESRHAFCGQEVCVKRGDESDFGTALGVTDSGAFRVSVDGVERHFVGGEISVRLQS